ncbi:hypothetical protein CLOM_g9281 [Closterium sp. NIES-68]|nr:hypothetical protein CLOM_g9281 [Closterium sp. NIES-68]
MACAESQSLIRAIEAACAASPAGADLLVTAFVLSLQSYRRPSVCRPFPSALFTARGPLPDKDYGAALQCCALLPPIAAIATHPRALPPRCYGHAAADHATAAHDGRAAAHAAAHACRDASGGAACGPATCTCPPSPSPTAAAASPWHGNMPLRALQLLAWILSPLMPTTPSLTAAHSTLAPTLHHPRPQPPHQHQHDQQQQQRQVQQMRQQQGRLHVVQVGDVEGRLAHVLTSWQMAMLTSSPAVAGGRNMLPQCLLELVSSAPTPPVANGWDGCDGGAGAIGASRVGGSSSGDAFDDLAHRHGSIVAFHGTSAENMHGILRCGLLNLSRTALQRNGSMHGEGIYLSTDPAVAFTFSQTGDATHALPSSAASPPFPHSSSTGCPSPATHAPSNAPQAHNRDPPTPPLKQQQQQQHVRCGQQRGMAGWQWCELGAAPRFVLLCEVITAQGVRCSAAPHAVDHNNCASHALTQAVDSPIPHAPAAAARGKQQQQGEQELGTYVVVENPCMLRIRYIMLYTAAPAAPPPPHSAHPSLAPHALSPAVPSPTAMLPFAATCGSSTPAATSGSAVHADAPASSSLRASLPCTHQRMLVPSSSAAHLASSPPPASDASEAASVHEAGSQGTAGGGGRHCGARELMSRDTRISAHAPESQLPAHYCGLSAGARTASGGSAGAAGVRRGGGLLLSAQGERGEGMERGIGDGRESREHRQGSGGGGEGRHGMGTPALPREVRRRGQGGRGDACVNMMVVYAVLLLAVGVSNSRMFWLRIWPALEGILLGQGEE